MALPWRWPSVSIGVRGQLDARGFLLLYAIGLVLLGLAFLLANL